MYIYKLNYIIFILDDNFLSFTKVWEPKQAEKMFNTHGNMDIMK
jgi:hypothetical protein